MPEIRKQRCPRCDGAGWIELGTLGERLRYLRETKGLTLRGVEGATGGVVSNAYLSQIETGKVDNPSFSMVMALANLYGVTAEELAAR